MAQTSGVAEVPAASGLRIASWHDLDGIAEATVAALRERYETAVPFPHLVLDDLFDDEMLRGIAGEFTSVPSHSWQGWSHALLRKRATRPGASLPEATQIFFDRIHSGPFLRLLSRITGVQELLPDPSLRGGGMHEIATGGLFELHVDFAHHPVTGLDTRLVAITYLNDDWTDADGGALELWRRRPRRREANIRPVFGRTVVMAIGSDNVHGHPQAVATADGRPRRSVAAYYYTSAQAAARSGPVANTTYLLRPGASWRTVAAKVALNILPPFVSIWIRRVVNRARPAG